MAYLVLTSEGRELHRERLLETQSVVLGRGPECGLAIKDPALSREHCRFEFEGDRWWIVDLESRNGTAVNSHRVKRSKLRDEDIVRVGSVRLVFHAIGYIGIRPVDPFEAQIDSMLQDTNASDEVTIPEWMPRPKPKVGSRSAGSAVAEIKPAVAEKPRSGSWMAALIGSVGSSLFGKRNRPAEPRTVAASNHSR